MFVLSFMTEGDTATWREQWLDDLYAKAQASNKTDMDFGTFSDLVKKLEEDFAAYDAPGNALENIKNLKYDTKNLIEDHISKFKALLTQSGMKESLSVIDYFRQTLPINLQRKTMLLDNHQSHLTIGTSGQNKLITPTRRHRECWDKFWQRQKQKKNQRRDGILQRRIPMEWTLTP